jgi:hypothetical protein
MAIVLWPPSALKLRHGRATRTSFGQRHPSQVARLEIFRQSGGDSDWSELVLKVIKLVPTPSRLAD